MKLGSLAPLGTVSDLDAYNHPVKGDFLKSVSCTLPFSTSQIEF